MITMENNESVPIPFCDLRDENGHTKVRYVDIRSTHYQLARDFMIRLRQEDLDDVQMANMFGLSTDEFSARYSYLLE